MNLKGPLHASAQPPVLPVARPWRAAGQPDPRAVLVTACCTDTASMARQRPAHADEGCLARLAELAGHRHGRGLGATAARRHATVRRPRSRAPRVVRGRCSAPSKRCAFGARPPVKRSCAATQGCGRSVRDSHDTNAASQQRAPLRCVAP